MRHMVMQCYVFHSIPHSNQTLPQIIHIVHFCHKLVDELCPSGCAAYLQTNIASRHKNYTTKD